MGDETSGRILAALDRIEERLERLEARTERLDAVCAELRAGVGVLREDSIRIREQIWGLAERLLAPTETDDLRRSSLLPSPAALRR